MALDSSQKRGSAIHIAMPSKQWLVEPDGTISGTDKQSLARFCSAVAFAANVGTAARVMHHFKQQGIS